MATPDGAVGGEAAKPKNQTQRQPPHPSTGGIKTKPCGQQRWGITTQRATVSLAPPPRRSGFSPNFATSYETSPPPPPADAMSRCRVETRPTVPLRRRGATAQLDGAVGGHAARPKAPHLRRTPPREGNSSQGPSGDQRRGITAQPRCRPWHGRAPPRSSHTSRAGFNAQSGH